MTDDDIISAILVREGGYVDEQDDHGGCTQMGITLETLRRWRGGAVTCQDVQGLGVREARAIYAARYLQPFADVDPDLKPQVVDIAVHAGVTRAHDLLATARRGPRPVGLQLTVERLKFYARIVQASPSQAKFLSGWIDRAVSFLA